ncbi:hypothetical protein HZ993_11750 [Rhodoferax sp. AJA081-3]|uniref:hypothetical protein n=1 Tax=Rhodoferax sp. AJA081-3 TaxID=2752316 RepID=UPI001AE0E335|nr:hypothetical protein [Rhodoferax sp. AJA081-3]QTN30393.1 hypothetical protein HZ993_11750 [Rhodoferax sp. AJA081-3]
MKHSSVPIVNAHIHEKLASDKRRKGKTPSKRKHQPRHCANLRKSAEGSKRTNRTKQRSTGQQQRCQCSAFPTQFVRPGRSSGYPYTKNASFKKNSETTHKTNKTSHRAIAEVSILVYMRLTEVADGPFSMAHDDLNIAKLGSHWEGRYRPDAASISDNAPVSDEPPVKSHSVAALAETLAKSTRTWLLRLTHHPGR